MTIAENAALLADFQTLPKEVRLPTYLELCRYPHSRLEEVTSRILSFYLHPGKEHGMKDLFLKSLLQLVFPGKSINFRHDRVKIILEDYAESKRIDIVVMAEDFVIGIENKLTASTNNPFDIYMRKLSKLGEGKKHVSGVVLSLYRTSNQESVRLKSEGFTCITYAELFDVVKQNLGFYLNDASSHYLPYLRDFMTTIENMQGNNTFDQQTFEFFLNNQEKIQQLTDMFGRFKDEIQKVQNQRISQLRDLISERTSKRWWIWQGFDLGYNSFTYNDNTIGIEAVFEQVGNDPLGKFVIVITTWNIRSWTYFEKEVMDMLPDKKAETGGGRARVVFDTITGNDEARILDSLQQAFNLLAEVMKTKSEALV